MPQHWYQKASVQTAIVTGLFLIIAAVITGLLSRQGNPPTVVSLDDSSLQEEIFRDLPFNARLDYDPAEHFEVFSAETNLDAIVRNLTTVAPNNFTLLPLGRSYRRGETVEVRLVFDNDFDLGDADVLAVTLEHRVNNKVIQPRSAYYNVYRRFNKLLLVLDVEPDDYTLRVGYIGVIDDTPQFVQQKKHISIR